MARNLSDIVGHLFPTTQVGSYPRPTWNRFDVRERDFRVAMRDAEFAESFTDGVRSMIGDQLDAGIDVPTDGHLWYDRHQGFISSFLLYPAYHLDGIDGAPAGQPADRRRSASRRRRAFGGTWNDVVVTGPIGPRHDAPRRPVARGPRREPQTVKFCSGMGPANLAGWLTDRALPRQEGDVPRPRRRLQRRVQGRRRGGRRGASSSTTSASRCTRPTTTRSSSTRSTARSTASTPYTIFHICHLASGVPVGITPYASFHEMVAKELDVDAVRVRVRRDRLPRRGLRALEALPERQGPGHRRHRHQEARRRDSRRRSSPPSARRSSTSSPSAST